MKFDYDLTLTEDRFLRAEAAEKYAHFIADKIRKNPGKYEEGVFIYSEHCPLEYCKDLIKRLLEDNKDIRLNILENSIENNEVCFDLDDFTRDYIFLLKK